MRGLELARGYFEEYGRPMLESEFAELMPYLAVGLVGSGSERYGYDDEISRDHDYEPGFCIFLPGEDVVDRRSEFLLTRAYAKLPKEYMGVKRQMISPVGGDRNGVIRTADHYRAAVGSPSGDLSVEAWINIPDEALAEAVNGEVFMDNYGEFTAIREKIANMPQDIRLKRIAGNLLIMGQSGQYNYARCLKHGEPEAAQLACREFVNAAVRVYFLSNHAYMPYYKWSFRALRDLPGGDAMANLLSEILLGDHRDHGAASRKAELIEEAAVCMVERLQSVGILHNESGGGRLELHSGEMQVSSSAGMLKPADCELERLAYQVNDRIADGIVRNMHILSAV